MTKVVSFKVSDEIYDMMKNTGKTFRELLEPLVNDYFTGNTRILQGIPKLITDYDHESICRWLDNL